MKTQIALEFKRSHGQFAALGTDTLTRLDGRWGPFSIQQHIHGVVARLRHENPAKYADLWFVGYNVMGLSNYQPDRLDVRMSDRHPPAWVTSETPLAQASAPSNTDTSGNPLPLGMSTDELLDWLGTYAECPDFTDTLPAAGFDEGYDSGWSACVIALIADLRALAGLPPADPTPAEKLYPFNGS